MAGGHSFAGCAHVRASVGGRSRADAGESAELPRGRHHGIRRPARHLEHSRNARQAFRESNLCRFRHDRGAISRRAASDPEGWARARRHGLPLRERARVKQ